MCVLCRCRVSSPVWRNVALRWGVCRKLWKPSGWTSAGWTRTCLNSENGSNKGTPFNVRPTNRQPGHVVKTNSSVCTIVGLHLSNSLYPGQSTNQCQGLCSTWVDKVFDFLGSVLGVVFASSGWLWLCVWQGVVRCKHTLLTLNAVNQTSPLQLSSKLHAWADNHASPTLLLLHLL